MQDAIFMKDWDDGHERFSADLDSRIRSAGNRLARQLKRLPETAMHGLLMAAAVAASSATLMLATPVNAAERPIQVTGNSVAVSYADLDIRTDAGRQRLDARARQAARQLCQPDLAGVFAEQLQRRNCYRGAVAGAHRQVDAAVIAFAQNRAGGSRTITVTAR